MQTKARAQMNHLFDQFSQAMRGLAKSVESASSLRGSVYGAGKPSLSNLTPSDAIPVNPKIAREKSKYLILRSPLTGEVLSAPIRRGAKRKPSPGLTLNQARELVTYSLRVKQAPQARKPVTRMLAALCYREHTLFNNRVYAESYINAGFARGPYQP